jgi:hypothetical protein
VLQRLVQAQPEPLARWLARDSQRFVGAALPFLSHEPVADLVVQLVLVSHLASAHGGAGASATLGSPPGGGGGLGLGLGGGGGYGGGGQHGMGVGGGFGGGLFGGLMGGGGGGGGGGYGRFGGGANAHANATSYEGALPMYSTRAGGPGSSMGMGMGGHHGQFGGYGGGMGMGGGGGALALAKRLLSRSLAGWGFLSVLASHVSGVAYAASGAHCEASI